MIAIVDYCAGNLRSVTRALDFLCLPNCVTSDPSEIQNASAVIVPGVGAAGSAMGELKLKKLDTALLEYLRADRPYLGICLGLQILFERSEEDGAECLGFFPGEVRRLSGDVKIPHIGWNSVEVRGTRDEGRRIKDTELRIQNTDRENSKFQNPNSKIQNLLADVPNGTPFYFVHSYFSAPSDESFIVATTTHGQKFPAILNRGNVWAVQFHPEKSGNAGITVLRNFAQLSGLHFGALARVWLPRRSENVASSA